ncbi:hypothetical protein GCM10010218_35050 [Streptomyces mashuensis]|uniref:DUF3592 domain-containing protein n=1 Tax=Streptomyces mashuensis TaxID=33904 RepID=A0A919B3L2_9ACTN|nr:DUF3592 domain-containing protein [Streptomyces mashuensis]GHF50492.1 hypothetical protein GCM10010218_35050 [Streptomyces mashuensis]
MRDVFFLALPALLAAGGIAGMVAVLLRARRLQAAWDSGIAVEGRCVAGYVVTRTHGHGRPGHSVWHHVHEFTTPEGEVRRLEEAGGPRTVVPGDTVTVRYPHGRPGRATALPPAARSRTLLGTGCVMAFLVVFVLAALSFMGFYLTVFKPMWHTARTGGTGSTRTVPDLPPLPSLPTTWPTDLPPPPADVPLPRP